MPNNNTNKISIHKLLSTCVDACSRGSQVIRFVNEKRKVQSSESTSTSRSISTCTTAKDDTKNEKDGTSKLNVVYKVADDPRSALTEADLASQCVILNCIRHEWGDALNIIGEEDEDSSSPQDKEASDNSHSLSHGNDEEVFKRYNVFTPDEFPIRKELCGGEEEIMVSLNDLTLYIDPMDGTREFVEQRLHNVQCLIGITWKGQPVGGVIGLPFLFNGEEESSSSPSSKWNNGVVHVVSALHWGDSSFVRSVQVSKEKTSAVTRTNTKDDLLWQSLGNKASECNRNIISVFSGDSNRVHKKHALEYLETLLSGSNVNELGHEDDGDNVVTATKTILDVCIAGGCGNKILRTSASGVGTNCGNAISIIPPGTCSWDTAAPSAVLLATMAINGIKGKVTDMFGGKLVYNPKGDKVTNDLGAFVSIGPMAMKYHEELCEHFRGSSIILDSLLRSYWIFQPDIIRERENETSLQKMMIAHKEPQAIDFVRNKEGYVLSCAELKAMIVSENSIPFGNDNSAMLIGYSTPEKEAVRGTEVHRKRVDKCVIHLFWEEMPAGDPSSVMLPSTVLYERIHSSDDCKFEVKLTSSMS